MLRTPAGWVLAAASAFMYISRHAINGWGSAVPARGQGILGCRGDFRSLDKRTAGNTGTVLSGWFSTNSSKETERYPALLFGILNSLALALFLYGGNAMWVNVLSMVLLNSNRRADLLPPED